MHLTSVIYLLLLAVTGGVGCYFHKSVDFAYRLITQLVIIVFIIELSVQVFYPIVNSTAPFYHALSPIYTIYIALIYGNLFKTRKLKLFAYFLCLFAVFLIASLALSQETIYSFPSVNLLVLSFFVVVLSLMFFYQMLRSPNETSLFKQPAFWFNSGNLVFYSTTALHFGLADLFHDSGKGLPDWVNEFIWILNLILYGCFLVSIVLNSRQNLNNEH